MQTVLTRDEIRAQRFPTQAKLDAEAKLVVPQFKTCRKAPNEKRGSIISAIWAGFDELAEVSVVTSKDLPKLAELWGFNLVTVKCQFYAWRATRAPSGG